MALSEHDIEFESHRVHYWEGGAGLPVLMLHGSGPGASTIGNWRLVLEPLSERYHVFATDLIGFGLSGRKRDEPYFDLDLWQRQAQHVLDLLPDGPVGVIGHSISAVLAIRLAAANERVTKVLTTGAMGAPTKLNSDLDLTWTFPETRDDLRRTVECLVYDKSVITDEFLDNRMKVLHSGDYGPYFRSMFAGDKQRFLDASVLSKDELGRLDCDVLMICGREDRPFPFEQNTAVLSRLIPRADAVVVARCGHSPALEHPRKLLHLAAGLFG